MSAPSTAHQTAGEALAGLLALGAPAPGDLATQYDRSPPPAGLYELFRERR